MKDFEILINEKSEAKINFGEMAGCVIKEVSMTQVQPSSAGKKIHFFCTFDNYYCGSDDSDEIASTPLREKVEVTQFVIGTSPNTYETEFIMDCRLNPVFTVEGPGSLKVCGKFIASFAKNSKQKEKTEKKESN
jgi:hypothetical protein